MRLSIEEVVLSGVQMQVHWNPRLLQILEKSHGLVVVYTGISSTMKDERIADCPAIHFLGALPLAVVGDVISLLPSPVRRS